MGFLDLKNNEYGNRQQRSRTEEKCRTHAECLGKNAADQWADHTAGRQTADAMRAVAENLHIATDDGSEGFKGLVTALIGELIEKEGRHYDECVAIGPMIMMKFVALTTKKYALKTTVALNALMVDGIFPYS